MTRDLLLDAIGDAKDTYILEAQKLRSGEKTPLQHGRKTRARKMWLLAAAIITLLALSITAYAVIKARIRLQLVQYVGETEARNVSGNVLTTYYPQSLPEGYRILEGAPTDHFTREIRYENDKGDTICYSVSTKHDFSDVELAPPTQEESLTISGNPATLLTSGKGKRVLIWEDPSAGCYASLVTEDAGADLIAMAQSVASGEELPLSFLYNRGKLWDIWYPQQLPDGYQCTDVMPAALGRQTIRYSNDDSPHDGRGYIRYQISVNTDLGDSSLFDDSRQEDTTVGGQPAKLVTTDSGQRFLFWKNETEGFSAMLETGDENVDLVAMAQSVAPGERLEVSAKWLGPDYTIVLEKEDSGYVQREPIYPQALPEGYSQSFVSNPAYGDQVICYENAEGEEIRFTVYFRLEQWGRKFNGMGEVEQVDINGHVGYRAGRNLYWVDEARGFGFDLHGPEDIDLLAVAKSVAPGPELTPFDVDDTAKALAQLGDYRITALPDGMVEDGLAGCPLENGGGWYSYVRRWYVNQETNQQIYFEYESYVTDPEGCSTVEDVVRMCIGTRDDPIRMVTINGCTGGVQKNDLGVTVVWVMGDPSKGTHFRLCSNDFTEEELLEIAKSIQK